MLIKFLLEWNFGYFLLIFVLLKNFFMFNFDYASEFPLFKTVNLKSYLSQQFHCEESKRVLKIQIKDSIFCLVKWNCENVYFKKLIWLFISLYEAIHFVFIKFEVLNLKIWLKLKQLIERACHQLWEDVHLKYRELNLYKWQGIRKEWTFIKGDNILSLQFYSEQFQNYRIVSVD